MGWITPVKLYKDRGGAVLLRTGARDEEPEADEQISDGADETAERIGISLSRSPALEAALTSASVVEYRGALYRIGSSSTAYPNRVRLSLARIK